jgi:Fe-S-cluster containining protein
MDNPATEDEPCEQCGTCCRIFGPGITPTPANVYVWIEQGHIDILRWFVAFREDGSSLQCTDLKPEELSTIVSFEFRNPDTGGYITVCPFLRRVSRERYLCGIHSVKPEMCCTYQPWVWGETYFSRCKSLRNHPERHWPS